MSPRDIRFGRRTNYVKPTKIIDANAGAGLGFIQDYHIALGRVTS